MLEIRFLKREEFQDAVRLADAVFQLEGQMSMVERFPLAFSSALGQSVGGFVDGRLVSFIGVVPYIVQIGPATLHVMAIGSVCTHPDYSGRGYAGAILGFIQTHARESSVSLLLVSGDGPLYARHGCRPFGGLHRMILRQQALSSLPDIENGLHVRPVRESDLYHIHTLHRERAVRFEMSLWDWATAVEAGGFASNKRLRHQVWVAEQESQESQKRQESRIIGFIAAAVPTDAEPKCAPIVIEWGGEPETVRSLMANVIGRHGLQEMHWCVPSHEQLGDLGMDSAESRQPCTVGIVDPALLLQQAEAYLKGLCGDSPQAFRWSCGHDRVRLHIEGSLIELNHEEFHAVVFEPAAAWPERLQAHPELGRCFPLPFPYTGGLQYL
ncbi:GNAT family N-acetyltransferase [Paenibacillus oryzisoli]|uniref:GNAT family N-acetyltransferase n=1 Tax=Paenibacillus oryzisoli TaxID=1850517 RepID=UPI003D295644